MYHTEGIYVKTNRSNAEKQEICMQSNNLPKKLDFRRVRMIYYIYLLKKQINVVLFVVAVQSTITLVKIGSKYAIKRL